MSNTQVGGTHYINMKIQPLELIDEYSLSYREGNVLKYIMRHEAKNGLEDLDKALDYLGMLARKKRGIRGLIKCMLFKYHTLSFLHKLDGLPTDLREVLILLLEGRCDISKYIKLKRIIFTLKDVHKLKYLKEF